MKQDKSVQLAHHLHHLEEMLELTNDPKLLWEEMQILGKKAFALQEKMEAELNDLENELKEVSAVQTIFETREKMWDIMNQLAMAELKLKEKTLTKSPKKCCCKKEEHKCCCHHKEHEKHCEKKCACKKGKTKCKKK
ncbi:MAG: hypothetical protein IKQ99_01625 [Alphaproteobacteria bacterium]|nr:hypothetical protein [Alphaproteobacteria bacterium]